MVGNVLRFGVKICIEMSQPFQTAHNRNDLRTAYGAIYGGTRLARAMPVQPGMVIVVSASRGLRLLLGFVESSHGTTGRSCDVPQLFRPHAVPLILKQCFELHMVSATLCLT